MAQRGEVVLRGSLERLVHSFVGRCEVDEHWPIRAVLQLSPPLSSDQVFSKSSPTSEHFDKLEETIAACFIEIAYLWSWSWFVYTTSVIVEGSIQPVFTWYALVVAAKRRPVATLYSG